MPIIPEASESAFSELLSGGISRREFLRRSTAAGVSAALFHGIGPRATRNVLRLPQAVSPVGLQMVAAPGLADIGGGTMAPGWLINGSMPSPLLRVRRGEMFDVMMRNQLSEPLILHWHGLTPPEHGDGHPRLAVRAGAEYHYRFQVENRAGTYWYHSHAHHRVSYHTQMGIAGLLIVHDDEEDALQLPTGEYEVPLILQDRKIGADGLPDYSDPDLMEGHLGDVPFGNGVQRPYLDVQPALYRFRILNGANARIFRLELSDARPLVIIGNDGGLLDRPHSSPFVDVGPGERIDVLIDMRNASIGSRIMLRSSAFGVGGHVTEIARVNIHGTVLDLLELRVDRERAEGGSVGGGVSRSGRSNVTGGARSSNIQQVIPTTLPALQIPDPSYAVRERTFRFTFTRDMWTRAMETHHINGTAFDMERVDVVVPFGETELWTFANDGWFAHPVHLHGTHFSVLSRSGGRGAVFPWEAGLKDTVLLHPNESVQVAVRFTAHRGLFLLHCHNLEHEDAGMMLNILVE